MRDILEDAEGAAERGDIGPGKSNRERDLQNFPKRFYKDVNLQEVETGHLILLDERPVKTPGRQDLSLPTRASAELVADEWRAVEERINPLNMPITRIANTALDGVANETQAVLEDIVRYASSDLLCYRAGNPEGLVDNQREHWDPVLDWASDQLGAHFELGEGITHVTQPKEAVQAFGQKLKEHADPISLACIHTFTSLTGSAILSLALAEGIISAEKTWSAAHVDEDWNISLWGEDYEAAERRKQRLTDFEAAYRLLRSLKT